DLSCRLTIASKARSDVDQAVFEFPDNAYMSSSTMILRDSEREFSVWAKQSCLQSMFTGSKSGSASATERRNTPSPHLAAISFRYRVLPHPCGPSTIWKGE